MDDQADDEQQQRRRRRHHRRGHRRGELLPEEETDPGFEPGYDNNEDERERGLGGEERQHSREKDVNSQVRRPSETERRDYTGRLPAININAGGLSYHSDKHLQAAAAASTADGGLERGQPALADPLHSAAKTDGNRKFSEAIKAGLKPPKRRSLSRTMSEWKEACTRSDVPQDSGKSIDFVLVYSIKDDDADDVGKGAGTKSSCCCCLNGDDIEEKIKGDKARERFRGQLESEGIDVRVESGCGVNNKNVYHLLHTPFWRLCVEAERVGLKMPLENLPAYEDDDLCACCNDFLERHLRTDDEDDYVSAPFRVDKLSQFKGSDDPDGFFRSSLRSLLTYMIMINVDRGGKDKQESFLEKSSIQSKGLLYMLHHNYYDTAFPMHDAAGSYDPGKKLILNALWSQYSDEERPAPPVVVTDSDREDPRGLMDRFWARSCRFQPIWRIRNYFGEKIALYFAWCGVLIMSLWPPLLFGIAVFLYGLYLSIESHSGKGVGEWKSNMTTDKAASVVDDCISIIKESFDNVITPYYALVISIWGTIFLEVWKRKNHTLAYEWDVSSFENSEPDRPQFVGTKQIKDPVVPGAYIEDTTLWNKLYKYSVSISTLIFMVCLVFIATAGVIVYRIIMTVDICEEVGVISCLILTSVVSALLNAAVILILGKVYDWLAVKLTDWENHRTQTQYDDSLIMKLFAFQFANSYSSLFYIAFFRGRAFQDGVFGLGAQYRDTCGDDGNCMSMLSFQILILMLTKPIPKFIADIILPALKVLWIKVKPCCMRHCSCCAKSNKVGDNVKGQPPIDPPDWEIEHNKPDLKDFTLAEYTEKVILYGFVMLFAASLSLAPLIALIILVIDIRVDSKRLLYMYRRPVAFIAQDLGMWYDILNFVNIVGVITNAFLIAFTSSWGNSFNSITIQLAIVIGFEHIVFAIKFIIAALIPDVPADIQLAIKRENYQIQKIMEESRQEALQQHKSSARAASRLSAVREEDGVDCRRRAAAQKSEENPVQRSPTQQNGFGNRTLHDRPLDNGRSNVGNAEQQNDQFPGQMDTGRGDYYRNPVRQNTGTDYQLYNSRNAEQHHELQSMTRLPPSDNNR